AHTHVTLHYTSSSLLPPLVADENQIRQMLINLLLNAIQAQPDGGAVFISTHYDPQRQIIHLVVQDKGPGIAQEQISEIWKPFFTTKETGTGLGLAIVHRIVQDHRGTITCVSEPGKGACFQVSLPVESS
ncbi:MAG: GHKL domain-containing protein, partial [Nitrospinota bacterium]